MWQPARISHQLIYHLPLALVMLLAIFIASASAQTTQFSYQGKLVDNGNLANRQYSFQFKLFDALSGGAQQGMTQTVANITVSDGGFAVMLDFGACPTCFNGAGRFLEIGVRLGSGNTFTTLTPRQQITSMPYALKSQNAATADGLSVACVTCINSSQIQSVNGSAVTGTIPVSSVPAGSANYIQNGTSQQAAANFNVSGSGTANILDATTQFNLGGSRILSNAGTDNLFAGIGAGAATTTGQRNAFFGRNAGNANTNGGDNAFFGVNAGLKSRSFANSFFGSGAGAENSNGNSLAFFGTNAGNKNVTGVNNSFYGNAAGRENTSGSFNTFVGFAAGLNNTTGNNNIFIGHLTGNTDTATQVDNSIAIGNGINVSTSNTIILGTSTQTTQIPGQLEVTGGGVRTFSGSFSGAVVENLLIRRLGANDILPSPAPVCFRFVGIGSDGGGGLTTCTSAFSSLRYKTNLQPFVGGIDLINRLMPMTFTWKGSSERDVGLNAEEVAEVELLLVTRNSKGEIEDVKPEALSILFINAFKEQQAQIKEQQAQLERQQREIDTLKKQQLEFEALKKLICASQPDATVCKLN